MAITDYEYFELDDVLSIDTVTWTGHVLEANFGDGYGAGVMAGNASGLREWEVSCGAIPDLDEYSVSYELSGTQTATRYDYLQGFFERHITAGNAAFIFKDPGRASGENRHWIASFADNEVDFDVFSAFIYGKASLTLAQRRVSDLSFNSDGTLAVTVFKPFGIMEGALGSNFINWTWTPPSAWHPNFTIAGYEHRLDGGSITDAGTSTTAFYEGLSPSTMYTIEVRAYDVFGYRSEWGPDTATTDP